MTVSKVTNEWLEEEAAGWEASSNDDWDQRPPEDKKRDADLAAAIRELLSRRAADEGAVTVEGWIFREEDGSHTFTAVDMGEGMVGWERASIAIRRRP